jgi:nucleoid-associated protein YgaU
MADVAAKYKRAFLELHEPQDKGRKMGTVLDTIHFSFNPKELTVQRTAEWKTANTKKPQPPEYNGAKGGTVNIEMFLDTSEGGEVKTTVDKLLAAVLPAKGTDDKEKPVAPYVSLGWGKVTYVACAVVNSVSAKYTRFDASGQAIRAVVTVVLQEVLPTLARQNPTSGGIGAQSTHVMVEGDSLASIATGEYGDPGAWRAIADANGIDDPFRIPPGRRLLVPSRREL